jgi:uncharacterized membrane protein
MVSIYHWKGGAGFVILGMLLLIVTIAALPASAQQQEGYNSSSLFIALFANGNALVEYDVGIKDPLANNTKIQLFGEDISDLVISDYEDHAIPFKAGDRPNEVVLDKPGASNLKISYTSSDFLSKDRRQWIFALNSTISFSVKLPPDSILTDPGQNPSIVLVGDQQLLTYKPGNIRFVYVIGALGTEEQANIVIKAAETTILQTGNSYPGIVLTNAKDLLQKAIVAHDAGRFTDAEKLADQANDAAIATGRDYDTAQKSLASAEAQINAMAGGGGDSIAATRRLLEQANNEFASGNYVDARSAAADAITAINDRAAEPEIPLTVIIAAAAAGAVGVGTVLFLKMRKRQRTVSQLQEGQMPRPHDNNNGDAAGMFKSGTSTIPPAAKVDAEEDQYPQELQEALEKSPIHQVPSTTAASPIDSSVLSHIVDRILEENPHLRAEDQQVLKFLVEKEGAAFESEVRSKFQLPRTTIWRLVKRLEREELIEIRKAGGQNLIKLRFEERQA